MTKLSLTIAVAGALLFTLPALAGPDEFRTGPIVDGYGPAASVADARVGASSRFLVAFDVAEAAETGQINRRLESAARFLNMHAAAGVPVEQISLAIVVHGPAALDLVRDERHGRENANAPLVAALLAAGIRIELCGQTAAARAIAPDDLLPGVSMSLSAMTSHAILQQQGYTLNPF